MELCAPVKFAFTVGEKFIPMKKNLKTRLQTLVAGISVLRQHRPEMVIYYSGGLGDNLLCTCVTHEIARRGLPKAWILSDTPALFENNPDIAGLLPNERWLRSYIKRSSSRLVRPSYASRIKGEDRENPPSEHLLALMCRLCGLSGPVELRPYLYLSESVKMKGALVKHQIAIHSSGMGASWPIPTKEWFPERFQQVVDAMKDEFNFVQLGVETDPLLQGALDMRGKTSFQETAAILSQSEMFIGQVGFLMHVARAVDCRSVIVYGGREHPSQSGYICNENVYTDLECAPCWRRNNCPFEHQCMRQIEAQDVVLAAERLLKRSAITPLEVEVQTLA